MGKGAQRLAAQRAELAGIRLYLVGEYERTCRDFQGLLIYRSSTSEIASRLLRGCHAIADAALGEYVLGI